MYTAMKFIENDSKNQISFSEIVNSKQMFITGDSYSDCYVKPFSFSFVLSEKEMRELRKHLTIQIRKIKKDGAKKS